MKTLAQPTDTGTSSQPPTGGGIAGAGQRVMDWAPAQLGLDGLAYAPATPATNGPTNEPTAGGEAPDPSPILGPYTDFVTEPRNSGSARRWERQRTMWDLLGPTRNHQGEIDFATGERVAKCRKVRLPKPDRPTPELHRSEFGSWDVTGTVRCGNAHVCPMCGFARARTVVSELSACIEHHLRSHPWPGPTCADVWMASLTVPHTREEGMRAVVERLTTAWRMFTRSREWRAFRKRWGIVGVVRCFDDTIGSNGLHGHWHVGLFPTRALFAGQPIRGLDDATRAIAHEQIAEELRDAWQRAVLGAGAAVAGDVAREAMREVGLHLTGGEKSAQYLASWGAPEELAFEAAKSGRTHWQLLDEARAGDMRARVEFVEYFEATQGLAVVTGLSQLRRRLGITDEVLEAHIAELLRRRELQAEADGAPLVRVRPLQLSIAPWYWSAAIGAGWHEVCSVADAADRAGVDVQSAVDAFLESHAFT